MEKISKKGRPEKISVDGKSSIKDYVMELKLDSRCDRTKMNKYYAFIAQNELGNGNDSEFSFILLTNGLIFTRYKKTILSELGRLEDPDLIRQVARIICENKFKTKDAVTNIRLNRTDDKPKGNVSGFAHAIAVTVDDYIFKHSNVDNEMTRAALDLIYRVLENNSETN